jgi:GNAT superfamily N-acetyltransferase
MEYNIQIRKATEKDFESVFRLIKEFSIFIKTPDKVSITVDQMILDKDYFQCLIAVDNDEIVGFATYFFTYYSWTGKSLYMDDLYVSKNYRGKKIGAKLFDAVINIGRMEKCRRIRWQVSKWNTKAIDFYKSRGAVIDEVEINCDLILNDLAPIIGD